MEEIQKNIVITIAFKRENPEIGITLKLVRDRFFEEPKVEIVTTYHNQKR
jgi:hypothetical protein